MSLLAIVGFVVFIVFFTILFFVPQFFMRALLFAGAISLSFLGGGRVFLSSIGGINADALKLFAILLGGLIILGMNKRTINLLMKFKFHLLFICYATISLIWCEDLIFGLRMIAKLLAPLFLLLMFRVSIVSQSSINKTDKWILSGGILVLILGTLANALGFSTGKALLIPRFTLPYLNANHFALYMLILSLFSLSSFYYQRKRYYLFMFLLFSMFCFISLSRIAIGAFFVSLSLFFYLISKNKIIAVITPILLCFVMFYAFTSIDILKKRTFFQPDKISFSAAIKSPELLLDQLSTSGRSNLWSLSLERFFWKKPIFGSGIGSTEHYFYGGMRKGKIGLMHSVYINMLCELGIIGCLLFVSLFLLYLVRMYRLWRKAKSVVTKKYALTAMLCVVSYLIVCITGNAIGYIFSFSMYIFAFVAFAFQCYEQEKVEQSEY